MKKELPDTTKLFSFFIRIPCKTESLKSVRCKPTASWSAGPLSNISRAYILTANTAFMSRRTIEKPYYYAVQMLSMQMGIFCFSVYQFFSA